MIESIPTVNARSQHLRYVENSSLQFDSCYRLEHTTSLHIYYLLVAQILIVQVVLAQLLKISLQ